MKGIRLVLVLLICSPFSAFSKKLIFPESPLEFNHRVFETLGLQESYGIYTDGLELVEKKKSLLGQHFYYQQKNSGVEVEGATLVLSVNKDNKVVKIYNTTEPIESMKTLQIPLVSSDQAIKIAWNHLRVDGEFKSVPTSKLLYKKIEGSLELVYEVVLSVSSPQGHWEVVVKAEDGSVLSVKDHAISRIARKDQALRLSLGKERIIRNFEEAMAQIEREESEKFLKQLSALKVNGRAIVFDPNPVVTLRRGDLQDGSPSTEFLAAYRDVELKDITFSNNKYQLVGPRVTIADFESPRVDPSETEDGFWNFERGNVAFNDAMTYYQLDINMLYIESLGYNSDKKIFPNSIEVDSNGVNGADNSHYVPYSRRIAFGHGCVDDSEDTDVILHEFGHAINHHINSMWNRGDTGAMGEGFGDYWAASYSATTEGGLDFHPEWVFKWDGHNDCWGGRKLNALDMRYDHSRNYYAHSRVSGGISDELWSTPIFQAFLELYQGGVSRGDIDKIILEAQFGLGSGVKMRDMAESIVKTAQALFPDENYDEVYTRHFQHHNILE